MDKRGQIRVTWLQRQLIQYCPKAIIKIIVDLGDCIFFDFKWQRRITSPSCDLIDKEFVLVRSDNSALHWLWKIWFSIWKIWLTLSLSVSILLHKNILPCEWTLTYRIQILTCVQNVVLTVEFKWDLSPWHLLFHWMFKRFFNQKKTKL